MRVVLTPGEMAVAHYMACTRRLQNQSSGIGDQRRDSALPALVLDALGCVSELAWFKHRGVFPDLSLRPRRGGPDDVLPDGRTVDIKSTWQPPDKKPKKLVCKADGTQHCHDMFVLAIVAQHVVDFIGYATGRELIRDETKDNLGHGPSHVLRQDQLHLFLCDRPATNGHHVDPISGW